MSRVLLGVAIVYDTPTMIDTPFGSFEEVIAPGALSAALARSDPGRSTTFVRDHNPSLLLARRDSGTLLLTDTSTGLRFRAQLPASALADETIELVRRGDLSGMSFSFRIKTARWFKPSRPGGPPLQVITQVERLYDVSAVTWPAYPSTTLYLAGDVVARSLDLRRRMLGRVDLAGARFRAEIKAPAFFEEWTRSGAGRRPRAAAAA